MHAILPLGKFRWLQAWWFSDLSLDIAVRRKYLLLPEVESTYSGAWVHLLTEFLRLIYALF
jgi:hypothetical protein